MKKSNHDHYIDLENGLECDRVVILGKRRNLVKYRCRLCQEIFDLPIRVVYDTDINERKA